MIVMLRNARLKLPKISERSMFVKYYETIYIDYLGPNKDTTDRQNSSMGIWYLYDSILTQMFGNKVHVLQGKVQVGRSHRYDKLHDFLRSFLGYFQKEKLTFTTWRYRCQQG